MQLTTDYLVVGAGTSGLAFTDTLVSESDADVLIVDKRSEPGGHWCDAYPFLRMHGPSVYYGVGSLPLGTGEKQVGGDNDGFYEQVTGQEVQDYLRRVLRCVLEPSGQVRFRGGHEYLGRDGGHHLIRDLATGAERRVRVRRSVVDARYLEGSIPATHTPSYAVDAGVPSVPVNQLPDRVTDHATYTVIGGGKTGVDACLWLLHQGTDPDRIRWVRPREAWFGDRAAMQPLDLVGNIYRMLADAAEIIAGGGDAEEMLTRMEGAGHVMRLDSRVPTMYRGTFVSRAECDRLRTITDVVRLGRVHSISSERLVLDQREVAPRTDTLYVDCSGYGITRRAARPVFEPGRITLQYLRHLQPSFNAALTAWVEAHRSGLAEKDRLCPVNPLPNRPEDWAPMLARTWQAGGIWRGEADLSAWIAASRLNVLALPEARADPVAQESLARFGRHAGAAIKQALSGPGVPADRGGRLTR